MVSLNGMVSPFCTSQPDDSRGLQGRRDLVPLRGLMLRRSLLVSAAYCYPPA